MRPQAPPPPPGSSLFDQILANPDLVLQDVALFDQLTPQEQDLLLQLVEELQPPEAAAQTAAGELGALDFLSFDRDVLGNHPTPAALRHGYTLAITPDQHVLVDLVERNQFVAVTSGHGNGKTNIAARFILYFLLRNPLSKVITTASTWYQVEHQLWQEIAVALGRSLEPIPGKLLQTELKIADGWFAVGLSTTDYSKFAGTHAPGGVLVWIDEATGVRPEIAQAAESMILTSRDRLVAVGNPTNPTSWFRKVCSSPRWVWHVMDCRNHPNVLHDDPDIIPGAVTKKWVDDEIAAYGEGSPLFLARVAGRWPEDADDAVIPLSVLDRARQLGADRFEEGETSRDPEVRRVLREEDARARRLVRPTVFSVDIAGPGGDLFTVGRIERRHYSVVFWKRRHDVMQAVGRLVSVIDEESPHSLVIDDTGMGLVVTSRLREIQRGDDASPSMRALTIIPVSFGAVSPDRRFNNMKSWMWWNARELLMDEREALSIPGDVEVGFMDPALPRGHSLLEQLSTAMYLQESHGPIRVFDKQSDYSERTKLLPSRSPDLAHAFILGAWGLRLLAEEVQVQPPRTPEEASNQAFHASAKAYLRQVASAYNSACEGGDEDEGAPGEVRAPGRPGSLESARAVASLLTNQPYEDEEAPI